MPLHHEDRLHLGFYYHVPAVGDYGGVRVPGFFGRFIDTLAARCSRLTCFLPQAVSPAGQALCDYELRSGNLAWVNIGAPCSTLEASFRPHALLRPFCLHLHGLDALLIRGPSPLLPALARAAAPIPVALLLVGDYRESTAASAQPRWRRFLIGLWAKWYESQQLQVARQSLTIVNSRKLYQQLQPSVPELRETRTTTLEETDFFERSDTCMASPVHLLYAGRYSVTKGLLEILEALSLVRARGEDVVLDLVGWPLEGEEDVLGRVMAAAQHRGVQEYVFDHGYHPIGPDLFAFYRRADIFVLASPSEGFPRAIWEAMANSLPVIATRVGSIPAFIEDAAELVRPKHSDELASAVCRLIHDGDRRRQLIRAGQQLARNNTLDRRSAEMLDLVSLWLEHKPEVS